MKLVTAGSLAKTLDAIGDAFFSGRTLPGPARDAAARWIASRQGLPGAYAGTFAPTEHDFKTGLTVFTGERITTRVGMAHILGEEACRALILLNVADSAVRQALGRASESLMARLQECEDPRPGFYCCGRCTVALWRHLAAGGLDGERRLAAGIKTLKSYRDGAGRWKALPFYYTLLALNEAPPALVAAELRYAAPACERYLKRKTHRGTYALRRRRLVEQVLEKTS